MCRGFTFIAVSTPKAICCVCDTCLKPVILCLVTSQKPVLVSSQAFSEFLHTHCPVVSERFSPTPWCWGGRLQTLVCAFLKSGPPVTYRKCAEPSFFCWVSSLAEDYFNYEMISYPFIPQRTHSYSRWRPDFSGLGGQWGQCHLSRVLYSSHSVDPPRPDGEQPAVVCAPRHQPGHPLWLQVSIVLCAHKRKSVCVVEWVETQAHILLCFQLWTQLWSWLPLSYLQFELNVTLNHTILLLVVVPVLKSSCCEKC